MSEAITLELVNRVQAWKSIETKLYPYLKSKLQAEKRLVLTVKPSTRSAEQNAKLHSMLSDISKQIEWAGKKRDIETWKRLVVAAWGRAEKETIEFLPAIDGLGVDVVFNHTSNLTKGEVSSLIEYVYAWGIEAGVEFKEIDQLTGEALSRKRYEQFSKEAQ